MVRLALTSLLLASALGLNLTVIRPTEEALQYVGRTATVATEHGYDAVMYDMPGVEVRFRVRGTTSVSALIQQHRADAPTDPPSGCSNHPTALADGNRPNNFLVFQDGVRSTDHERLNPGSSCFYCTFDTGVHDGSSEPETYHLVTGLDVDREYEIWLSKDSEAYFDSCEPWPNWVMFHGILIEEGAELRAPLAPRDARTKIEIIGGATASGYCNLCGRPWNAPVSTGGQVLKATSLHKSWVGQMCGSHGLDSHCHVTAWSGMGLASGLDKKAYVHLPTVFRRTVQSLPDAGNRWNFSSWRPDAVVLDIGLEDAEVAGELIFRDAYLRLIHDLVDWYGPQVRILAACGTTTLSSCQRVRDIVTHPQVEDLYIYYLPLDRSGANSNICCDFPDAQTHEELAEVVKSHVLRALADNNGPDRSSDGPLAAIFTLVAFGATAGLFLLWHCVQKCRSSSTSSVRSSSSLL